MELNQAIYLTELGSYFIIHNPFSLYKLLGVMQFIFSGNSQIIKECDTVKFPTYDVR